MTGENKDWFFWKEWRDILLAEFELRMAAAGVKGQWIAPASKTLTVLFLQVKGFSVPAADILPMVIGTIKSKNTIKPDASSFDKEQYDTIAMLGHRIGMVDNSASLKQYLQDVRVVLKPEGQILLTSLNVNDVSRVKYAAESALSNKHFQQASLIGPFFSMLRIKADTLKNQAVAVNWHCEFIYRQDDSNYFAWLSQDEFGYPG
jgi:hypothetical protein